MILIVCEEQKNCYALQKQLDSHDTIRCISIEYFEQDILKTDHPDAVVFSLRALTESKIEMLRHIENRYKEIAIFLLLEVRDESNEPALGRVRILSRNLPRSLIAQLLNLQSGKDWGKVIKEVKEYIEENIEKIKTIDSVAEKFGIDARILVDMFYFHCGQTLGLFIRDTRLEKARRLLTQKDTFGHYIVIAEQCGYKNLSSLSPAIKNETGMTVKELHRRLLRQRIPGEA